MVSLSFFTAWQSQGGQLLSPVAKGQEVEATVS